MASSRASSWITTPDLRLLPDAEFSESRPSLTAQNFDLHTASSQLAALLAEQDAEPEHAHERMGAAQISVKVREDGPPTTCPPSILVLDKQPKLSAPAIVALQVEDGPPTPSDVHSNVFTATPRRVPSTISLPLKREPRPTFALPTAPQASMSRRPGLPDTSNSFPFDATPSTQTTATFDWIGIETTGLVSSPLPKHQQVAGPQPYSSSSTFDPQDLVPTLTTNSQAVAPISVVPNSPTMGSSQLSTFNQSPTHSPVPENRRPQRPTAMRSSTLRTVGTSVTGRSFLSKAQSHSSQYTDMIIESVESVSFCHTVLSAFLHWIILAGFLVLPAAFNDLQKIAVDQSEFSTVLHSLRHAFVAIGFSCCGIGAIGLCALWYRWSHNYIWLLTSIFIPGIFSGLSGLISTFVNLYGPEVKLNNSQIAVNGSQQGVHYGSTTIATIAATGGCTFICSVLTAIYSTLKRAVKRRHDREFALAQERGEGGAEIEYRP